MNNIAFGKYIPGKSFIHKLDPRTKIFLMILLINPVMGIMENLLGTIKKVKI